MTRSPSTINPAEILATTAAAAEAARVAKDLSAAAAEAALNLASEALAATVGALYAANFAAYAGALNDVRQAQEAAARALKKITAA